MKKLLDLERFPLDRTESREFRSLVARCKVDLENAGMFNLEGFLPLSNAQSCADCLKSEMASSSFTHERQHNIYFKKSVPDLPDDHLALRQFQTVNHTLCADQLADNQIMKIYQWPPLVHFLALTLGKEMLFPMQDPLARVNVMAYYQGEALNWHFDRSEFTTTLLLQAPDGGGEFEYRTDLRSADDPNYDGVAKLLSGQDASVRKIKTNAGTLNVFRGINTPHRVTPVEGKQDRIVAVFSYYDRPGVMFNAEERMGFYGRGQ